VTSEGAIWGVPVASSLSDKATSATEGRYAADDGEDIMPTKRMYYEHPYLKECRAKVVKINGSEVFLDETCFFPEGGGQVGDTGEIDGVCVVDTRVRGGHLHLKDNYPSVIVGADIAHIVDGKPPFSEGDFVTATLDWERRYSTMRYHSAAHFVYHFFMECFGEHPTKGCSIDDTKARFDFIVKERLEKDKLKEIQQLCNETILQGLDILTVSEPEEQKVDVDAGEDRRINVMPLDLDRFGTAFLHKVQSCSPQNGR